MEMEIVREQLQEMEVKSARLEKEIGLFKAKEQKLGQHLGKDTPAMKENQAHPTGGQRKSLENPAETIEEEEVHPIQSPKSKDATPTTQLSPAKNTQKITHRLLPLDQHKLRNVLGLRWYIKTVR